MKNLWIVFLGFFAIAGCQSANYERDTPTNKEWSAAVANSETSVEDPDSPFSAAVPDAMNRRVESWLDYFQGRGRKHMVKYLARAGRYEKLMTDILKDHGLPEDLIYVVYIESGFSSRATSHASAVGYWQFIRGTGKNYGLKINGYVDERRDPELATHAAAKYFKSLYSLFGSWYLSLAAYNAGENRIKGAVMRNQSRDFWELARKNKLPRETMNYVPKYLAARLIAKNPEKYGFYGILGEKPLTFARIEAKKPISLSKLASNLGVSRAELKKMNPKFKSDYVPIFRGRKQEIRVPLLLQASAEAALEKSVIRNKNLVASLNMNEYGRYRVRRGDTLSHIARRQGTRISTLRRLNGLGRRSMIRVGQVLKVPAGGRVVSGVTNVSSDAAGVVHYKVRSGDTLSHIARRFGTRISVIRKMNRLNRRSLIRAGQILKIPGRNGTVDEESRVKVAQVKPKSEFQPTVHVVSRGETLIEIARKYRVSLSDIAKTNALKSRSVIHVGKRLTIPD